MLKNLLHITTCLAFLLSLKGERSALCSLVDEHVVIDFSTTENRYDNGYKEDRYNFVLDTVIDIFNKDAHAKGGSLNILRDWSDGAVNAWAWRMGDEYWLEVPGGMARYYLIDEAGFLTTICHELGHLFGGAPHRYEISYEGQADYHSVMKCMERVLSRLSIKNEEDKNDNLSCRGSFCLERFAGIKSLTSYYAELEKVPAPTILTPSEHVVSKTLRGHPGSQCRFDTMVAALRCSNREPFSYESPFIGSCVNQGSRPKCWFSPEEFPSYN